MSMISCSHIDEIFSKRTGAADDGDMNREEQRCALKHASMDNRHVHVRIALVVVDR